MLNRFKKIILFSVFSLPIICPTSSFAWHDYDFHGDWDYHGSGRDYPYSYYISEYYSPGYAVNYPLFQPGIVDIGSYPPAFVPLPAQITQIPAPSPAEQNEFTVNIPNGHGSYTAVVIKRSGNGFTGPQGEYYPEFPKIFQLEIMYGK